MPGMTVCSDCGSAYGVSDLHICPERRLAAAHGFEGGDEAIIAQLRPSEELLTKVKQFVGEGVSWKWSIEITKTGIDRILIMRDPTLPSPHDNMTYTLLQHEDWEDALKALGLLR